MDAAAGASALPSGQRATTPALTHKSSRVSAADTFASATDGEGYYTDAGDVSNYQTDDGRSGYHSAVPTVKGHSEAQNDHDRATMSRSSSAKTARWEEPITTTMHQHQPHASTSTSTSPPTTDSNAASADPASEEPGRQIEPEYVSVGTHHKVARHCAVLGLLSFAAIWGTLIREGLVALNTYDGESVAPVIWAQAVGCLIMGLAIGANRKAIEGRYPPAYIMVTTGLCGSITTFSSFMLGVFRAFGNQQHFRRHGLHNVMDALSQTALTFGMSIVSVGAGIALSKLIHIDHLLALLPPRIRQRGGKRGSKVEPGTSLGLDMSMLALGAAFWIGSAIFCALYSPYRSVLFSLIFAPPGAILRWYLSRYNTSALSKRHSLPLGTLAANLIGTAVICAAFTASRSGRTPNSFSGGLTGCQVLKGLQDGFCGCLSTVSTLAVELRTIVPRRRAVRYAVVSWVCGVLICVLLIGAPWWSIGMDGSCVGIAV